MSKVSYFSREYMEDDENQIIEILSLVFNGWPSFDIERALKFDKSSITSGGGVSIINESIASPIVSLRKFMSTSFSCAINS
jgi:hypothetical protein